ncbi:MAG: signal peptidase II [Kiritimatiellae bacterium]|nr:signal peptidase II [Kiritimatiellia bacterium]
MLALIIAILVTVLDQVTKYSVRMEFALGESVVVIPGFFDLTYLRNTGAAWGMLGGQNALLTVLSVVMLAAMVLFRRAFLSDTLEHRIALGLMVGGIIGNLLDRMRLGWVTDFLDFHIAGHHWPAFNVADAAICVGVGLYVISSWWMARHALRDAGAERGEADPAAGATR